MPELPEVETICRRLAELSIGKTIARVDVLRSKSFQGDPETLVGAQIVGLTRRSKILQFNLVPESSVFVNGQAAAYFHLLVHLKMTGQLIFVDGAERVGGGHPSNDFFRELPSAHTRVHIVFSDGTELFFNDMRVFGWLRLVDTTQLVSEYAGLALDVIDPTFNPLDFVRALERKSVPVKQVIMDNAVVAGVGNIYACDALHLAGLDPRRSARSLSNLEAIRLFQAMRTVIALGIEQGGATISAYRTADGLSGKYQDFRRVYMRESEPCQVCSMPIQKIKLAGRGTFFCPTCQK